MIGRVIYLSLCVVILYKLSVNKYDRTITQFTHSSLDLLFSSMLWRAQWFALRKLIFQILSLLFSKFIIYFRSRSWCARRYFL